MNKTLLIVGGVAAIGVVGYLLLKKTPTSETTLTTAASEQKSSDTVAPTSTSTSAAATLNAPVKGGTKRDISGMPVISSKPSTTSIVSTPKSTLVPKASNETETFAFTLNF